MCTFFVLLFLMQCSSFYYTSHLQFAIILYCQGFYHSASVNYNTFKTISFNVVFTFIFAIFILTISILLFFLQNV